jgi:DNA-binding NarL/FixJ family response regulator
MEADFEVVGVAGTAEEAIRMAEIKRPDLSIMDIRLAGIRDGIDVATEMFSKYGIQSIFATAHSDSDTLRGAEIAHPLGWLAKPYSPNDCWRGAWCRAVSSFSALMSPSLSAVAR